MGRHKAGDDGRPEEEAEGAHNADYWVAEEEEEEEEDEHGRDDGGAGPGCAGTRRWGAWARGGTAGCGRRGEGGGGWGRGSRVAGGGGRGSGRIRSDLKVN